MMRTKRVPAMETLPEERSGPTTEGETELSKTIPGTRHIKLSEAEILKEEWWRSG